MVLEIVPYWPTEVFIQRHFKTMLEGGYPVEMLGRSVIGNRLKSASVNNISAGLKAEILPDFNVMGPVKKFFGLKHLTWNSLRSRAKNGLSNSVLLGNIEKKHPELIHFHSLSIATRMSWIPVQLGIPYTISIRGSDIQVKPLLMQQVDELIVVLDNAAGLHVVANELGKAACNLAQKEINYTVIYTTIPVPAQFPDRGKAYGSPKNEVNFITVGRLHWTKGYPALVKAIKDLRDFGIDAKLTIIGSGDAEERIRFWVRHLGLENEIHLTGKLNELEISKHLQSADAFIQSSVSEGLSNSMAEALASGCPVFATAVGGTSEVVIHGENGYLLDPFDPESWVEELSKITNISEMARIGMQGYETAKRLFSSEVHYQEFSKLYDTIINHWKGYKKNTLAIRKLQPVEAQISNPEVIRVLIKGNWKWQTGSDLILYAINRTQSSIFRVEFTFLGTGQQEDELRYLTRAMKLDRYVKFVNSIANEKSAYGWGLVITLTEDEWLIEDANGDACHLAKDEKQMEIYLEDHFKKKPSCFE